MQPDQKQSFIQRLSEPTGRLVADLALDCRTPLQAPQSCSHPPAFFLRRVIGKEGMNASAAGRAQSDLLRAICTEG